MTGKRICKNCGKEITISSRKCKYCGMKAPLDLHEAKLRLKDFIIKLRKILFYILICILFILLIGAIKIQSTGTEVLVRDSIIFGIVTIIYFSFWVVLIADKSK